MNLRCSCTYFFFFFLIVVFLLCNCLCIMCVVYSPLLGGNKGSIHLLQLFIFLLWYFLCMFEFYASRRLINLGGRGVCMATV